MCKNCAGISWWRKNKFCFIVEFFELFKNRISNGIVDAEDNGPLKVDLAEYRFSK